MSKNSRKKSKKLINKINFTKEIITLLTLIINLIMALINLILLIVKK